MNERIAQSQRWVSAIKSCPTNSIYWTQGWLRPCARHIVTSPGLSFLICQTEGWTQRSLRCPCNWGRKVRSRPCPALGSFPGPVKASLGASEKLLLLSGPQFPHLDRRLGRPYPCMGSRAGNPPGPRSPRAAPGTAEAAAGETHAAAGATMPTRRLPYWPQSQGAPRLGGGEGRKGASVRPAPVSPRAPPARRSGRSSRRAGGTIESPRHRPLHGQNARSCGSQNAPHNGPTAATTGA